MIWTVMTKKNKIFLFLIAVCGPSFESHAQYELYDEKTFTPEELRLIIDRIMKSHSAMAYDEFLETHRSINSWSEISEPKIDLNIPRLVNPKYYLGSSIFKYQLSNKRKIYGVVLSGDGVNQYQALDLVFGRYGDKTLYEKENRMDRGHGFKQSSYGLFILPKKKNRLIESIQVVHTRIRYRDDNGSDLVRFNVIAGGAIVFNLD